MANFKIDETQEEANLVMRMLETSDPVHADIYNPMFGMLLNNSAYLARRADAMGKEITDLAESNKRRQGEAVVTLTTSGWSSGPPYTQTVDVPGLKETDKVQMMSAVRTDTAAATADIWDKMGALVRAGKALDGKAMFSCPKKKPTSDFNIKLVGVSADE